MTQEEKQKFIEKLNKLQQEYNVRLTVFLTPANWFARVFRKLIKITWQIYFVEDKSKVSQ